MTFPNLDVAEFDTDAFIAALAADLGISPDQIANLVVSSGSVIVTFVLLPDQTSGGIFAAGVAESLTTNLTTTNMTSVWESFGSYESTALTPAQQLALVAPPPSPSPPPPSGGGSGSDDTIPMIVGIVCGAVALIAVGIFFWWRRLNRRTGPKSAAVEA